MSIQGVEKDGIETDSWCGKSSAWSGEGDGRWHPQAAHSLLQGALPPV